MTKLFDRLPGWIWALLFAGAVATSCAQTNRLEREQRLHAETRTAHAQQLAAMERSARQAEQSAREEEQRRAAAHQEIVDEARTREAQALADAAAAGDASQRLRAQLAAITARGGEAASHPGTAQGGPPAGDPIGVLADVLARADERWPQEARHYTYVAPQRVRSTNPGYCFQQAGWRRCGLTKGGHGRDQLVVLERF